MKISNEEYLARVEAWEAKGCTTSDAQGVVDAELMSADAGVKVPTTPVCVRSKGGWCSLIGRRQSLRSATLRTRCGVSVPPPWRIEHREPDCVECMGAKTKQHQS